ncbi:response regulator [Caldimonas sp. KR1-144]|uniref:response regulator n=1 Tax=Caldimonas sp. KR1-144 TaxID=3400911 RepID=UPI003C0FC3EC
MPIRTLLADDHQLFRQGMAELLMREEGIDLVGQTGDGLACVEMARELRPNVVITDLTMPSLNGIDVTRRVVGALPDTKVVCVSIHDESHMVSAAIEAGAAGYVLKSCAFDELARCVRAVSANQVYLCPAIASIVVTQCRQGTTRATSTRASLTPREREIAQLLAEGYTTKQIAYKLAISVKTVGTHREHLMRKLRLTSIAALTRYAMHEGLI